VEATGSALSPEFQSDFNVAASKMLFFMQFGSRRESNSSRHQYFCAKLSTIRAASRAFATYGNATLP